MRKTLNRATALLAVNNVIGGIVGDLDLEDPTLLSYLQARFRFHQASGRRYFKTPEVCTSEHF